MTIPQAARLTAGGRGAIAVIGFTGTAAQIPFVPHQPQLEWPLQRLIYGRWREEDVVVCRTDTDRWEVHCHGGDAAVARILHDLAELGMPTHETADRLAPLSHALTARTADLLNEQEYLWRSVSDLSETQRDELQRWERFARHLTQPWQVVLTGRPNVGKSSLINALLGYQRVIVAAEPGTTRDVVTAVTAFDGWPVQLSDTAGLRTTSSELEAAGIERARIAVQSADLVLVVVDLSEAPTDFDRELLAAWRDAIVVGNKCDQPDRWETALPAGALLVSSLTGAGLEELQRQLVQRLIPAVPPPGTLLPVS